MQKFDVVVVGAGGAGLTAAIAARKQGAKVAVLHKTTAGLSTCTAYAGGGFTLASGKVSPETHFSQTMETGRFMSREPLLTVLSEEGEAALRQLQEWGVTIRISDGHASVRSTAPTPLLGGGGFTSELTAIAREIGVIIIEETLVTRLQVADGIRGVEFVNWRTGETGRISCSAVVLANGGAGYIYQRTDNPARITGDGYHLALQAGLKLTDMEFVQFYPLGWDEPGFPRWMIGLPIIDKVRVTDETGDEFFRRELNAWGLKTGGEANLFARDRSARLLGQYGRKGKVLLHLNELSPEEWQSRTMQGMLSFYPSGQKPWEYGPVGVNPVQHYFTGGVEIDPHGRTGIDGLFACGEVTGGVDGASRIGGNALTNIVVFGLRAGQEAAGISGIKQVTDKEWGAEPSMTTGPLNVVQVRNTLREVTERGLGPVRNREGIVEAIAQLEELKVLLGQIAVTTSMERLMALEMPGMVYSALAVAQSALLREESRGVHYRDDYPEERQDWQKPIFVSLRDGQVVSEAP